MSRFNRPIWIIFLGLLIVAAAEIASPLFQPKERIPWRNDMAAARAESIQSHRPLLAYFTASWCGYCQEMKHTTWADRGVEQALSSYVPVKVDVDEHKEIARQFGINGLPSYVVLDDQGKVLQSGDGALTPSEFTAWLRGRPMYVVH